MLGRLVAILTFRRRTDCCTGPAKVIDGNTIVVSGQLVRLHGIDAPNWTRRSGGEVSSWCVRYDVFGTLEAIIAGVRVR